MSATETPLVFDCAGEPLLGILTRPARPEAHAAAVLIVVGGPQYRAGSHRQFVQLARALGAAGHWVLRFDVRGMGDSTGAQRSFEQLGDDIAAALDRLQQEVPALRRFALFGLCDGASAALLYLQSRPDPRITDLCVLNPWVRSEATLARTHLKHYYVRRVLDPDFWRQLLRGRVGWGRLREFAAALRSGMGKGGATPAARGPLPFQQAMAMAWKAFRGRILVALSAEDLTAREFAEHAGSAPEWRGLLERPNVTRVELAGADHTLSNPACREAFEAAMRDWLAAAPA